MTCWLSGVTFVALNVKQPPLFHEITEVSLYFQCTSRRKNSKSKKMNHMFFWLIKCFPASIECWSCYNFWRDYNKKATKICENCKVKAWVQITDQGALSVATDLVMALSKQWVTASNSLVSCSNVIARCCSYQTPATLMLRFLSLPHTYPWEPLRSKQKLHEHFFFVFFSPCKRVCEVESVSPIQKIEKQ